MAKKSERELVDEVVERLGGKFPQLPVGLIATAVEDAYMHLGQSVIRDYIPLLVERRAHNELLVPAANPNLLTRELVPTA
jgi:hypothetical protein